MKILYGVQGTGNGHVSRANAMAEALRAYPDIEITWLLSGRDKARGCGGITDFTWREGLTFVTRDGRVRMLETLAKSRLRQFWRDAGTLDPRSYDLVISDYEPVSCHAARKHRIAVVGISHLYAFDYQVPRGGGNRLAAALMKRYAPVDVAVGLHWHHFGEPILPPILDLRVPALLPPPRRNKVVVYLPWENSARVLALLAPHRDTEFYIYHADFRDDADAGHLHRRALSRTGFKRDLLDAWGVVANCGFELISECLHLGKHVLTRPLAGQMEQLANAAALQQLGYARVMPELSQDTLRAWLNGTTGAVQIAYPDVARHLAAWIAGGCIRTPAELAAELWRETSTFSRAPSA